MKFFPKVIFQLLHGDRHTVVAPGHLSAVSAPKTHSRGVFSLGCGGAGGLQPHPVSHSQLLFSSRDDVIGKVCITRDMLVEHPEGKGWVAGNRSQRPLSDPPMRVPPFPTGYSGWVSLSEVDPDEEVQGEIHLRVEVQGSQGGRRLLRCTVLEAR